MIDRAPDSPENPHAGFGSVMLDIGGDVGALIVTMPDAMAGEEVDIAPAGEVDDHAGHGEGEEHDHVHGHGHDHGHGHGHGHRPHVAVVRRPVASGELVASLVYPELVEGDYRLYLKGTHEAVMAVTIRGGEVTEAVWPH